MRPEVAEASMQLAVSEGFPVLTPSGRFCHDARCAWHAETIDNWLEREWKGRYRPGWFSASELGQSDETLILGYRGELVREQPDAQKLRQFARGHDTDLRWKGYLHDTGLSAVKDDDERNILLTHLRLRGACDDIVVGAEGGHLVWETKSTASYIFGRLDGPNPDHVTQVGAYMAGLGLRSAIVMYENADNQATKMFWVDWDQQRWDAIAARLRRLRAEAEAE